MTEAAMRSEMRAWRREFGGKPVDYHCPYDEAQLRESKVITGQLICTCCFTHFPQAAQGAKP